MRKGARVAKRARSAASDDDDSENEDESCVWQDGTSVYFFADVDLKQTRACMQALRKANVEAVKANVKHVSLYIHSGGGDVLAGFTLFDFIRTNALPVHTYACGYVASAATFLLIAGQTRYAHENSILLIHQMKTGFWGKFEDLKDEMKNSKQLMARIRTMYLRHCKMGKENLRTILRQELEMNAQRALEYGVVDVVIPTLRTAR